MDVYALLDPAVSILHHLLVLIAGRLPLPGTGVRFAVALALVGLAGRLLLLPLAIRAATLGRRRAVLAPRLAELRRRHADDPRRLLRETSRLQREAGVSPAGDLLVLLARLPLVACLYRLTVVGTVGGGPNLLLAARLFGAPLAAHWPEVISVGGLLGPGTVALVLLLVMLTVLAAVSAADTARRTPHRDHPDHPAAVGRVIRLLPYGTVLVAPFVPVALGVHLLVGAGWAVLEGRLLDRIVPA